jgi:hypothetical protein
VKSLNSLKKIKKKILMQKKNFQPSDLLRFTEPHLKLPEIQNGFLMLLPF